MGFQISLAEWQAQLDRLARDCIVHMAEHGWTLALRPETPVVPDMPFGELLGPTTWADVDDLARRLGACEAGWVNLRFGLLNDGSAIVRYEANIDPQVDFGIGYPWCNGGADCHRSMSHSAFRESHRLPASATQ
jgi:hypothetical protein